MPIPTVHFLLVYSHKKQMLIHQDEFTDSTRATAAYTAAEKKHANEADYEIVLIGSDSIQTVMRTHGHYFGLQHESAFAEFLLSA